jgi:hypothetical protein
MAPTGTTRITIIITITAITTLTTPTTIIVITIITGTTGISAQYFQRCIAVAASGCRASDKAGPQFATLG